MASKQRCRSECRLDVISRSLLRELFASATAKRLPNDPFVEAILTGEIVYDDDDGESFERKESIRDEMRKNSLVVVAVVGCLFSKEGEGRIVTTRERETLTWILEQPQYDSLSLLKAITYGVDLGWPSLDVIKAASSLARWAIDDLHSEWWRDNSVKSLSENFLLHLSTGGREGEKLVALNIV